MIHLLSDKDRLGKVTKSHLLKENLFHCSSRSIALFHGSTLCARVCGSKFGFSQVAAVKFCFFRFIWLIMSAKRTYAEVVSGVENTPDDDQSWMRAYQRESEEDALKKAIKLRKV